MKYFLLFLQFIFGLLITHTADAQLINVSHQVVFYNFKVQKCTVPECGVPYLVELDNIKTVQGTFKGINNRITPILSNNDFLITIYDKKTGDKIWQTVIANPVEVNVEYDGAHIHASSDHQHESNLQRKIIELEEGIMSLRLPYSPDECTINVSYIASPSRFIDLATFNK